MLTSSDVFPNVEEARLRRSVVYIFMSLMMILLLLLVIAVYIYFASAVERAALHATETFPIAEQHISCEYCYAKRT